MKFIMFFYCTVQNDMWFSYIFNIENTFYYGKSKNKKIIMLFSSLKVMNKNYGK
jgi:hypothetical protein